MNEIQWTEAAGSCGFNIEFPVYAAYVNGIALFAFKSCLAKPDSPFFTCVVTGHQSCGGATLEEAQAEGVAAAMSSDPQEADRKINRLQFNSLVADTRRRCYVPVAVYVIGCCRYGQHTSYKTVEVPADSKDVAMRLAQAKLGPTTTEHLCHVKTKPNPVHLATTQAPRVPTTS